MTETALYLPDVRQQYEDFPYPPRIPADETRQLHLPHLSRLDAVNHNCFMGRQNFHNFKVLVAGGGTGDTTIAWAEQLRSKNNSGVVYLDMSQASSSIAKQRATIRKLKNIQWIHDSILNIPNLNLGPFDFIECSGVLHHLKDPDAGLQALAAVLKPSGAMNLMVYGAYGRTGIYQMQELMRLVNGNETDAQEKIENTKKILKDLPKHHALNTAQAFGVTMSDATTDAGIYDLFLHSQDRAYTIFQVHEWLEKCGLRMAGEPGFGYGQLDYLPETYIKDKELLEKISHFPLKIQQSIGEAMSTRPTKHEFYAVHQSAPETVATTDNQALIPWTGMFPFVTLEEIANAAEQYKKPFHVKFDTLPGAPQVFVPYSPFVPALLRLIDGKRSIRDIIQSAKSSSDAFAGFTEEVLLKELKALMTSLNRAELLYLRHPSVDAFTSAQDLHRQMTA